MTKYLLLYPLLFSMACAESIDINPDQLNISHPSSSIGAEVEIECIFAHYTTQADYPEGMKAWNDFLKQNLQLPEVVESGEVEGSVFLSFTISIDGSISNIQVINGLEPSCDKEAKRVLSISPNWIPGTAYGETVETHMQLRITFIKPIEH